MNVLELINNEINNKNWTIEEKIRYIYIKSCSLFHYDSTYNVLKKMKGREKEVVKIVNASINLENVENFNVICKSFTIYVLQILIEKLLNIKCKIKINKNHYYLIIYLNDKKLKLDATTGDLAYVKMNAKTIGYYILDNYVSTTNYLLLKDKNINYIKDFYFDDLKVTEAKILESSIYKQEELNKLDIFLKKFTIIQEEFNRINNLNSFSDSCICLEKLKLIFCTLIENLNVKSQKFFQEDHNNWEFIKVFSIMTESDILYYILEKKNDCYNFHSTNQPDVKYYIKNMKATNRNINLYL